MSPANMVTVWHATNALGSDLGIPRLNNLTSENATKLGQSLLENFYNHPKHDTSALNLLVQWNLILLGLAE